MDEIRAMAFNCRIERQGRQLFRWRVACAFLAAALAGSWAPIIAGWLR